MACGGIDPRLGGPGVQLRTHVYWVHDIADGVVLGRNNAPRYMKLCLPLAQLQCLARYRLAALHLEGRRNHGRLTAHRYCPLCSASGCKAVWLNRIIARCGERQPEDLLHFMLDCPAYDHIKESFPSVFSLPVLSAPQLRLHAALSCVDQQALVKCTWHMDRYRCHLLGLKHTQEGRIMCQPAGYIPANRALWCRADFGLYNTDRIGYSIAVVLMLVGLAYAYIWWYARQ